MDLKIEASKTLTFQEMMSLFGSNSMVDVDLGGDLEIQDALKSIPSITNLAEIEDPVLLRQQQYPSPFTSALKQHPIITLNNSDLSLRGDSPKHPSTASITTTSHEPRHASDSSPATTASEQNALRHSTDVTNPMEFASLDSLFQSSIPLPTDTTTIVDEDMDTRMPGKKKGQKNTAARDKAKDRKERRMLSNRESARRSRKRKQEYVAKIEAELSRVVMENNQVKAKCVQLQQMLEKKEKELESLRKRRVVTT